MKKIQTIDELKADLKIEEQADYFINLGYVKSSKNIFRLDEDKWYIINEIDDSEQILTSAELNDRSLTHVGEAMKRGNFYKY